LQGYFDLPRQGGSRGPEPGNLTSGQSDVESADVVLECTAPPFSACLSPHWLPI